MADNMFQCSDEAAVTVNRNGLEYRYRLEDCLMMASMHDDLPLYPARVEVRVSKIPIIKRTKCGMWVGHGEWDKHWVRNNAVKKYAHPTKLEAIQSFIARKKRQIKIVGDQLNRAKMALAAAEQMEKEEQSNDSGTTAAPTQGG